jgi:hypothetical protein
MTLQPAGGEGTDVTIGLVAAAKLRVLDGRADRGLFHTVPERARLAAAITGA